MINYYYIVLCKLKTYYISKNILYKDLYVNL